MKNVLSILLCAAMVLSLFAGCAGSAPAETTAPATPAQTQPPAEPTAEPTTEPTLSPEEQLLNSLPERMTEALDLGLVELHQLEDLGRTVTVGEVSAMLQLAYVHRIGAESMTLADLSASEVYSGQNATRGFLASVIGLAELEIHRGEKFENFDQWMAYAHSHFLETLSLWGIFPQRLGINTNYIAQNLNMADVVFPDGPSGIAAALAEYPLHAPWTEVFHYSFMIYDATTGKRVMTPDADGNYNPHRELTVEEAVDILLRYYNYPNPAAIPEFIAPEEMGSYNRDIITAELLEKETTLPEASCAQLPSQWRGTVMDDLYWLGSFSHPDMNVYEYELQAVKDAGFNFIGLEVDFNYLQDYSLFNDAELFDDLVDPACKGHFSVERLEQLDRILAWCMENDIHLNIRGAGMGGFDNSHSQIMNSMNNKKAPENFAKLWRAIALRYADIPNEYLSFTVLSIPNISHAVTMVSPSIKAIQEVSPDRCIMAEIFNHTTKAPQDFAKLGVALSYRIGEPYAVLDHWDYYTYDHNLHLNFFQKQELVDGFTWPYEGMDAKTLMTTGLWGCPGMEKTMEIAQQYGVGFMVGDFGVNLNSPAGDRQVPVTRYPDEGYKAMIFDVIGELESRNISWCFAHWHGYFAITDTYPAFANVTYAQLEDYPCYVDTEMLSWFKELNGVE